MSSNFDSSSLEVEKQNGTSVSGLIASNKKSSMDYSTVLMKGNMACQVLNT